jgi:hypothetical protein
LTQCVPLKLRKRGENVKCKLTAAYLDGNLIRVFYDFRGGLANAVWTNFRITRQPVSDVAGYKETVAL